MTTEQQQSASIYDGEGDKLMHDIQQHEHVTLVPDAPPSKQPDSTDRIRLMWGQHMLEDVVAGRYRSLVCAVNAVDNSHGIISQLAELIPTSQWDEQSITRHAKQFSSDNGPVKVIKYDMDMVEVLAVLRPTQRGHLMIEDVGVAFTIVSEMINRRTSRKPTASVSFLGARSNCLHDENGNEPSLENVLRVMYNAGYVGDVYPPPQMWNADTPVFARYPFPASVDQMRHGGF